MERGEEALPARGGLTRGACGPRRALPALALFVALASLVVYAARGRAPRGSYELADDCPRGALVYAQASDLPGLLRLWDGSELKGRYLASANFGRFAKGHLALKLAERAKEFEDALGFAPDAAALAEAAEKRAAVALYDIGRMELVFVAPVGEEKALAARFFQGADDFEKTELPGGAVYYGRDVEADRGRQKQKILFAFARGRFVLATSEPLMLRTLANLFGRSRNDRLSDEPAFKTLTRGVAPHTAAVWVDQARLNEDYYFKHYWAMGDPASLKGLRAGLFDFEMREGGWLERREFLTDGARGGGAAPPAPDVRGLAGAVPADSAYARLRALPDGAASAAALVRETLLDGADKEDAGGGTGERLHEVFNPLDATAPGSSWDEGYAYLGEDYDEAVDDPSKDEEDAAQGGPDPDAAVAGLERALAPARPSQSASAADPLAQDGPLFVEFRRLAVLRLDDPGRLDARALEAALASLVAGRLTVAGAGAGMAWADAGEGSRRRRELALPMLGWKLCYALRDRELFVSNDAAFLDAALAGGDARRAQDDGARPAADDVTVIRLDRRGQAFDAVFRRLDAQHAAEEFFTGNVGSLLDVASPVTRVEISRRTTPGRLHEEVELSIPRAETPAPPR